MDRGRSLWFGEALLPGGWADAVRVLLRDGRIAEIRPGSAPEPEDERHAVALPGLPNVHSHAFQRAMAGLAERRSAGADSFWTWRDVMYRFVARLGPAENQAIAALAYMEMLESGFTRVGEFHYLHHPSQATPAAMIASICAAAEATGIGLTLLPSFYAHSDCGGLEPAAGQLPFVLDTDTFSAVVEEARAAARGLDDAVVGIAPHSLRAVTPEELRDILPLAAGGPIHIHAAEQMREVAACVAWSGQRPVEWLLDHVPVDQRWCLIHATHMTEEESRRLAASGAVAGLCPVTEANLGDGIFPAAAFWQAGAIAVGTDSNVRIGAGEELRALEYAQRLTLRARNVLCRAPGSSNGGDLYRAALEGGARALGAPGGLAAGAPADLVSLAVDEPSLLARRRDLLLDAFVFCAASPAVDCVWRAGRRVVSGGRHRDRAAIVAQYRAALAGMPELLPERQAP
jgi:formiminoglutamate deiminase